MDKLYICNLALFYLGNTRPLTSLSDNTTESRLCNQFYDIAREILLAEFPWSFAKKSFIPLTLTDETNEKYTYVYEYPTDALRILSVGDGQTNNDFEIIYATDGKRIVCDIADAKAEYIMNLADVNAYSGTFIDALAWKLASMIGIGLSKDPKFAQYAGQMATMALEKAKHMEALQIKKPINQGNRYITARR